MSGVINRDASLPCARNGAFESTEGPVDATEETDLAFLHQGATRLTFNGNRAQARYTPTPCMAKQRTRWSREGQKKSRAVSKFAISQVG